MFDLRIPESRLEEYIHNDDELRKLSYKTLFHKEFTENLDKTFPYLDMKLKDVGIPPFDVVQVSTEKGVHYVELSADARYFEL